MRTKIQDDFKYLHDVPFYDQSSQDMHCGYYCALMLLVARHGKGAWRGWWENRLESKKVNEELDGKGLGINTLQGYLEGSNRDKENEEYDKYRVETKLIQIKGAQKNYRVASEGNLLDPDEFCEKIKNALEAGKPSILRLPYSFHHPYGHFVVIKGYAAVEEGEEGEPRKQFIVNDPLVGETSLWISGKEFASALRKSEDDGWGAMALISTEPTCLFKEE